MSTHGPGYAGAFPNDSDLEDIGFARLTDAQLEAEIVAKHRAQAERIKREQPVAGGWKVRALLEVDRKP